MFARVEGQNTTISTIVSYLMPDPYIYIYIYIYIYNIYKLFYTRQFSLAFVRSLNVTTVLFQTILFSISTQFKILKHFYLKQFSLALVQFSVYAQLNVETILFQSNSFYHKYIV